MMMAWTSMLCTRAIRLIMYLCCALLPDADWRAMLFATGRLLAERTSPCQHASPTTPLFDASSLPKPGLTRRHTWQASSIPSLLALLMNLIHEHEATAWCAAV